MSDVEVQEKMFWNTDEGRGIPAMPIVSRDIAPAVPHSITNPITNPIAPNPAPREAPHTPISQWPDDERPREKLIRSGPAALSDAELLAVFLRTGVKGKSAVDIGRELLCEYGSLRQVLLAGQSALARRHGLGPAKSAQLHAALELGRRYLKQKLQREGPLTSPQQAVDYLTHQLRDRPREVFAIMYLDNRHHVLEYEELFQGSLHGAAVHPREVARCALEHNASAVIVAHNHPSGIAEPSASDAAMTAKLKAALNLVEVRLLDHLVIGDGEFVSLSERGLF